MFGQIPDFTDGFEFLRKMWGSASGMAGLQAISPPMDLDEIDKRIHDLQAVEGWLQFNTNMLRTTIQGLEVQRATLVALKTFGNALSPEAMQTAMENVARAANAPSASPPRPSSTEQSARQDAPQASAPPSGGFVNPFAGAFTSAFTGKRVDETAGKAANAVPEPDPDDMEDEDDFGPEDEVDGAADTQAAASDGVASDTRAEAAEADTAGGTGGEPPPHANLWWEMLQRQFNQVASSAAAASLASLGNIGGFGSPMGMPGMPGASGMPGMPAMHPSGGNAPAADEPAAAPEPKPARKSRAGATARPAAKAGAKAVSKPAPKAAAKRKGPVASSGKSAVKSGGKSTAKTAAAKTMAAKTAATRPAAGKSAAEPAPQSDTGAAAVATARATPGAPKDDVGG